MEKTRDILKSLRMLHLRIKQHINTRQRSIEVDFQGKKPPFSN